MLEHYQKFVGRICTVLTSPVNFEFKDPIQHSNYFSGKVISVDKFGIWIQNVKFGTMSFFPFPVIGLIEEQAVMRDDPRYDKIKAELEEKKSPRPIPPKSNVSVSVEELTEMAKKLKKTKN